MFVQKAVLLPLFCSPIFSLPFSVSASYVRQYFATENKAAATQLAKTIHNQFIETLRTTSWMDDESRAAAIVKAERMNLQIAYPDELVDTNQFDKYYQGLELTPDSLIHSIIQMNRYFAKISIGALSALRYDNQSINRIGQAFHQ